MEQTHRIATDVSVQIQIRDHINLEQMRIYDPDTGTWKQEVHTWHKCTIKISGTGT